MPVTQLPVRHSSQNSTRILETSNEGKRHSVEGADIFHSLGVPWQGDAGASAAASASSNSPIFYCCFPQFLGSVVLIKSDQMGQMASRHLIYMCHLPQGAGPTQAFPAKDKGSWLHQHPTSVVSGTFRFC